MTRFIKITAALFLLLIVGAGVATAQSVAGVANATDNKQTVTVTCKVVSVTDDEPLVGAIVVVQKTQQRVTTDRDGNFSIEVPMGSTIVVSYAGYEKAEVKVNSTTKIVRLIPCKPEKGWIYLQEPAPA